jgi:uncharacterized membrane protein
MTQATNRVPDRTLGDYALTACCNRALTPYGRWFALGVICLTTLGVAASVAAHGAWPVLPFAGLEVLGLAAAFYVISRHDGDYERLTIREFEVRFERCSRGRVSQFEANRHWAQLICQMRGSRCRLALRSHGRQVDIGRLLNDEQRIRWANELRGRLNIVSN